MRFSLFFADFCPLIPLLALTVERVKSLIQTDDTAEGDTDAKGKDKDKKKAPSKLKFLSKNKNEDNSQETYLILAGYLFILRAWLKEQINAKDVKVSPFVFQESPSQPFCRPFCLPSSSHRPLSPFRL